MLPAALRERLGLKSGDRLILTVDSEGGFRVISTHEVIRRALGMFQHIAPGRSLVDELIAERREEARREEQEIAEARKETAWRRER